jgi:hypothetical protein
LITVNPVLTGKYKNILNYRKKLKQSVDLYSIMFWKVEGGTKNGYWEQTRKSSKSNRVYAGKGI